MIVVNELTDAKCHKRAVLEPLLILMAPYAPHIAEITEAEFNNFPHFIPQNWVYGMEN